MQTDIRPNLDFSEAPKCAIGKSRICEGQGLFLIQNSSKGDIIINYNESSKNWNYVKYEDITKTQHELCWWVGVDHEYCLIGGSDSIFMRINHSRNPNLLWIPKLKILVAIRDIFCGEELTYDYHLEIANSEIKNNPPLWSL